VEPQARVFAPEGREHVAIVLQVVADDERGAVLAVAMTADALTRAEGLDADPVAKHDRGGPPHWPLARRRRIVGRQAGVVEQLGLEVFQVGAGLAARVADDPEVRLAAFDRGPQRIRQRADRRLGPAARPEQVEFHAPRVGHGVQARAKPAVHPGGRLGKMPSQIVLGPIQEAERPGPRRHEPPRTPVLLGEPAAELGQRVGQPLGLEVQVDRAHGKLPLNALPVRSPCFASQGDSPVFAAQRTSVCGE